MNYSFVQGLNRYDGFAFLENGTGVKIPVKVTEIESCGYPRSVTYTCEEIVLCSNDHASLKNNSQLAINITIEKVIFNDPATIVFWSDGTKTVVKTQNGEKFDPEKGLAMAIAKRAFGNKGNYFNHISKWVDKYEEQKRIDKMLEDSSRITTEMAAAAFNEAAERIKKLGERLANLE